MKGHSDHKTPASLQERISRLEAQIANYQALLENMGNPMGLYAPDGELLMMNQEAAANLGGSPRDFIGRNLAQIIPQNAREYLARINKAHESQRPSDHEDLVELPGGKKWFHSRYLPVRDRDGRIFAVQIVSIDITQRKQAEVQLRERDKQLSDMHRLVKLGHWRWDLKSGRVEWSGEMYEIFGLDPESFSPRPETILQRFHPGDQQMVDDHVQRILKGQKEFSFEARVVRPGGGIRHVASFARGEWDQAGEIIRIQGAVQDISKLKAAERKLSKNAEKFSKAFHTSPMWMAITTMADGVYLEVNQAFLDSTGFERQEVIGRTSLELGMWPQEERRIQLMAQLKEQNYFFEEPVVFVMKDGRRIQALWSAELIELDGKTCLISAVQDITERLKIQNQLAENMERFKAIGDNLPKGMIYQLLIEADGRQRFTYISNGVRQLFNCSPEEAMADVEKVFSQVLAEDRPSFLASRQEALDKREVFSAMMRVAIPGGGFRWVTAVSKPREHNHGGTLWDGVAFDVTEREQERLQRREMEERLRQAQKMEALGTLAGGIAHDFNNILAAISGYAEMALADARLGQTVPADLEQIIKASQRAKNLVNQILTFSRKMEPLAKPLDMNREVLDAAELLKKTLPKMIEIQLDLELDAGVIMGDPGQIEQVILNLCTNARDAMPQGGRLVISTRTLEVNSLVCQACYNRFSGEFVRLSVQDFGQGMSQENLQKMFDPFYTTKEVGKGTGLGMSTIFGIIRAHKGHLTVESAPDRGTTVSLFFPPAPAESAPAAQEEERTGLPGGGETVLLVDDEEALRQIGSRALMAANYRVLTACSGEEALTLYQEHGQEVDLVILDLNMPGMGGLKCLQELMSLDGQAAVLVASGYTGGGRLEQAQAAGAAGYLMKPYSKSELLLKIRELMDS